MSYPLRHISAGLIKRRGIKPRKAGVTESAIFAVIMGGAGLALTLAAGTGLKLIYLFGLLCAGAIITEIDLKNRIIPNELIIFLIIWSLIFGILKAVEFKLLLSLAGMAICLIIFLLPAALKKQVGAGDIKLACALGFSAGIPGCLYAVALMGGLIMLYIMLARREPLLLMLKKLVPMGPFMAAALIAVQAVR
jgi:Flp pilus assembly protein protease CpaA